MKQGVNYDRKDKLPTDAQQEALRYDAEDMRQALEVLSKGGIILYPTDTIWGLGCDATNSEAVKRIYELKKRQDSKSMLSLVGSEGELERCVKQVPDVAWMLIDAAVKPLTIIYDQPVGLAPELLAEDGSAGIRITSELFSATLCRRFKRPIVSTSANVSGMKSPSNFREIDNVIKQGVDYIVRYRRNDRTPAQASNIIKVSDSGIIKVIR